MTERTLQTLVVEDHASDAEWIAQQLSLATSVKFEITPATRASEACESLAATRYDLVLLDLTLPDDEGSDALLRIATESPESAIAILTTREEESWAMAMLDAGAEEVIVKREETAEEIERALLDAVQRHRLIYAARKQTMFDPLTSLRNRTGFLSRAAEYIRLARIADRDLLILTGTAVTSDPHSDDDEILRDAAGILKNAFRGSDLTARLESDRFAALAIVHPGDNSEQIVAMRIDELVRARSVVKKDAPPLHIRFQLRRLIPPPDKSAADLLTDLFSQALLPSN